MLKWSVNNIKTEGMVDTPNSPVHQITISGNNYKSQVAFSNDNLNIFSIVALKDLCLTH